MHGLYEHRVLLPDLVVEGEELPQPGVVGVRREEVVEVSLRAPRPAWQHRADREVRRAGEDVDPGVRVEQVELPVLAGRLRLAELRAERRVCFEQVAVGVDVDLVAEAGVRRRAVVALEEVLDHDLPVRVRAELDARVEDEPVDVDVVFPVSVLSVLFLVCVVGFVIFV
jgi:hypothetical protein